jgi:hypothetical protein
MIIMVADIFYIHPFEHKGIKFLILIISDNGFAKGLMENDVHNLIFESSQHLPNL